MAKQAQIKNRDKNQAKFYELRKLKCFEDIKNQILEGKTISDVVSFIQKEKKEMLHLKETQLTKLLYAFRNTIPKEQLLEKNVPVYFKRSLEKANRQINVLQEYTDLMDIQWKRVRRAVEQEDTIGMNMVHLENSIKNLGGILNAIHDIQSDLGITPRNLGSLDVQANVLQGVIHSFSSNEATKVLENPVSRHKVLTVADRILALTAEANNNDRNVDIIKNLLDYDQNIIDAESIKKDK